MKNKKMYISLIVIVALALGGVGFMKLERFGRLPRGDRQQRVERSPNYRGGEFRNQSTTPQLTSDGGRAGVMYGFLFEKKVRNRPDVVLPSVKSDLRHLPADRNIVVWFGHSSYFMQIDGRRFLVDPVFYDAAPLWMLNRPFRGTDIYKTEDMLDIDYLIITHDHWDHLDHRTVTELRDRVGKVVCPLGVGEHFERWGYGADRLVELDWYEQAELDTAHSVHCMPARHFSGRTLQANKALWASFVLKTPATTVFVGGDGGYDRHFEEIAELYPSIDLALMENGQYNKDWRYIHMMPNELAMAVADLNPRVVIAGHNSKYALAKHPWDEPLDNAATVDSVIFPIIGSVVDFQDSVATAKLRTKWWKEIK